MRTFGMLAAMAVLALVLTAPPSEARGNRDHAFGDWSVMKLSRAESAFCWLATTPVRRTSHFAAGQVFLFYSPEWPQFSATAKGTTFPGTEGTLEVGGEIFKMYFEEENGWFNDADGDRWALARFQTGRRAVLSMGDETLTLSLAGFREALKALPEHCPG